MVCVAFFPQIVLKCIFMFKSNSLVNPEDLVFFWCSQDQKATGGTEIYFLAVWRNKVVRIVGES